MKFAPLIRDARRRSLLSHDELASAVGVSPKAIWLAEQGAGTLKTLIGVLDQLQVPITGLPPASNLGARVHAARIKRGWSLQKLSERCGLSIPTIRGLEQGRGRIASLEAVIDALAPSARVRRSGKFRRAAPRSVICAQVQKFENADCVEVMRNMECGSVDLVVTSPPYNAGKEYEGNLSVEEYVQFAERWVSEIPRVLTPTGALWLNVGYFKPTENQAVPLTHLYYPLLVKHGLSLLQEVTWHFEGGNAYLNRFSHRTERWMWVAKDPENYIFHLDSVRDGTLNLTKDTRNNSLGKNPTDYWYFDRVVGGLNPSKDRTAHPAQFPVEMVERIIRASSNPGDVVLDPFSGSGTTVIAAWQNGRKGIGIEVDPRYHKIANKRLDEVRRKCGIEPSQQLPGVEKLAS